MRLYHNQLASTLQQSVKPLWLIFGDEPWQKNDSLQQIKASALQQGFDEVIRLSADDKFDWSVLTEEYQSMSLFSSQRVIEIELVNGKVNEVGTKVLTAISEQLHQDVLLIIHGPKLDAPTQKRKWFKTLEKVGAFLPLYDIEGKQLNQWLLRQARALQVNLHQDLVFLMVELFEGNLPALSQELHKLSLLFGQQIITCDDAESLLIKQAKFNPFQITDALLVGNLERCIAMLEQMQQEGTAAGQLVWIIHKELQLLYTMIEQINQGVNINELFKQHRIWDKRKPLYQQALNTIKNKNISLALARLAQTDLLSKSNADFNAFTLLADVCISLYHGDKLSMLSLDYEFS